MPVTPISLAGFARTRSTTPNVHERRVSAKVKILHSIQFPLFYPSRGGETLLVSLTRTYHEAFKIQLISTSVADHYCINMALVPLCEAKVSQTLRGCRSSILPCCLRFSLEVEMRPWPTVQRSDINSPSWPTPLHRTPR